MVVTALLALALIGGVPPAVVGLIALGAASPWLGLAVVASLAAVSLKRSPVAGPADEAQWLATVASELRGGASLRTAVVAAAHRSGLDLATVERRAAAGVPLPALVPPLARAFPVTGPVLGPAIRMAATSGGAAAAIFHRLAARAAVAAGEERERRADTAGARLSAWIVGAVPVLVLALLVVSGRAGAVMRSGTLGTVAVALGVLLQVAGLGAVVAMSRRARRW